MITTKGLRQKVGHAEQTTRASYGSNVRK